MTQTVQVSGAVGANVSLLVIESDYLVGTPSLDPFEANNAEVVSEYNAVIGAGGLIDIPVTLTDGSAGELHYLAAVVVEAASPRIQVQRRQVWLSQLTLVLIHSARRVMVALISLQ